MAQEQNEKIEIRNLIGKQNFSLEGRTCRRAVCQCKCDEGCTFCKTSLAHYKRSESLLDQVRASWFIARTVVFLGFSMQ